MDCLFCKMIKGEIPIKKVYEDENVLAFHDIAPNAPVHVLVIPKLHIGSANEVTPENSFAIAKVFEAIPTVAKELGLDNGYRIISNCGEDALQSVKHIHFHILGGKRMEGKLV